MEVKVNIGIDLDGVLTNYRKFAIEQGQKYCEENNKGKLENPAINGASENIKKLKEDGHTIFIITARKFATPDDNCKEEIREKMKKTVKEWLAKNEIEYDYIIFSSEDKSKYIIENNIDVMVEDSPNNVKRLSKLTKIICMDWPYNKGIENDNIYRCYNWNEIYDKILEINKK